MNDDPGDADRRIENSTVVLSSADTDQHIKNKHPRMNQGQKMLFLSFAQR